jgi:hypothetical protein
MTLRYYMDVHVPSAVTEGLRRRGIDVLTSQEDGTREHADADLLERAATLGRVLFSQDKDLLAIAANWQRATRSFDGLIFAEQEGLSIGRCIDDLALIAECCTTEELASQVLFVPL